jgi:hypothetical protein
MKTVNGITIIDPIIHKEVSTRDILLHCLSCAGATVSSIPKDELKGQETFSKQYELFDPEKVNEKDNLPPHWYEVYEMHNRPEMKDCRDLCYRYVHCPEEIYPYYPKVLCKGIFCLTNRNIKLNKIHEDDLTFIGDEIFEEKS